MNLKKMNFKNNRLNFLLYKNYSGFTLIEVLIGIFLISIVFLGIIGAYQLIFKTNRLVQEKVIATYLANQQMEVIKNLPYTSVGIRGGFPNGVLEVATTTINNGVQYTIETSVFFVVDSADGIALPEDACPTDYKRVKVKVSWTDFTTREIQFTADIAPKDLAQECGTGGGILSVLVFDAFGMPINSPRVEVKDPADDSTVTWAFPADGLYYFPLATSTYKVVVSKDGYSTERSYGTNEVATPDRANPLVIEGQLTPISFSIDEVSNFSIDTFSAWGSSNFSDPFSDETKISEKTNLVVADGKVELASSSGAYFSSGHLFSDVISPASIIRWDEFSFSDSESIDTSINYQIYYASGTDWYLIPESDLPGNSAGFSSSPINLSGLTIATYDKLKLKGNFSTASMINTPTLYDWQVSWVTSEADPISNADFKLRGNKTIGKDSGGNPVYKYSISTTTNSSGHKNIQNLEWDLYTFSAASGLNLINIQPSPQPVNLLPDSTSSVNLYLGAQNSLLVTIEDINNLMPVFAATVRLYKTGYDYTQSTNSEGQTYFIPLSNATYSLEISALDYLATSTTVNVSGDKTKIIKLELEP